MRREAAAVRSVAKRAVPEVFDNAPSIYTRARCSSATSRRSTSSPSLTRKSFELIFISILSAAPPAGIASVHFWIFLFRFHLVHGAKPKQRDLRRYLATLVWFRSPFGDLRRKSEDILALGGS
jgi:hypothetical protein